jgi:hypothetical protein
MWGKSTAHHLARRAREARCDVGQNLALSLVATPRLKAPMNGFVVRIALRQHVPLRAGVQNPKHQLINVGGGPITRILPRAPLVPDVV